MNKPVIICVDDEPIVLAGLRIQLSQHFKNEAEIEVFESGEEALEAVQNFLAAGIEIPVAISDHIMPGLKGDEFLVRLHLMTAKTLKILLTGQADGRAVGNAVNNANLYRYIGKPWDVEDLVLTVKEAMRQFFLDKKLEEQNQMLQRINRELSELNTSYSRFVPLEFLSLLQKEKITEIELGDHISMYMAVMFSDIRSFTHLSEHMTSRENFEFVNDYLGRVSPIIRNFGGFIIKYLGDGMMAVFPTGATDAIRAAIAKLQQLRQYNVFWQSQGRAPIEIGIGIHFGHLMVGMVGESARIQGDAFSDNVNLASRMEGLTKYFGVSILVSDAVLKELPNPDIFHYRFLGKVQVIGRTHVVKVYEVLESDLEEQMQLKLRLLTKFNDGLNHYVAKEFAEAIVCFKNVLKINQADKPAQLYLEKAARFIVDGVPDDWQGIEKMGMK